MNPLRELWRRAATVKEDLAAGLRENLAHFNLVTKTYDDVRQVHGYFRLVSSDGSKELGYGFHCPGLGDTGQEPQSYGPDDFMQHCGRREYFDPEALYPTVRQRPRYGRYQIASDGTRAMPTDLGEWDGTVEYEPSDPAGRK